MPPLILELQTMPVDTSPDEVGGKAIGLALLHRCKAPIAPGFVIPASTLARIDEAEIVDALGRRMRRMQPPFILRSSSNLEDSRQGAAPGLFRSVEKVQPEDFLQSVKEVLRSLTSEAATAYAQWKEKIPKMAVVVQPWLAADARGTFYAEWTDSQSTLHGQVEWLDDRGDTSFVAFTSEPLSDWTSTSSSAPCDLTYLSKLARSLRGFWQASPGIDIEWIVKGEKLYVVQARPLAVSTQTSAAVLDLIAFSKKSPQQKWTLDIDHNPDPLSQAQIDLVDAVSQVSPTPLRVVGGYLYQASSLAALSPAQSSLQGAEPDEKVVRSEILKALARLRDAKSLEGALIAYVEFFKLYTHSWSRVLRTMKRPEKGLQPFAQAIRRYQQGGIDHKTLIGLIGVAAANWDVATPTFREDPRALEHAIANIGAEADASASAENNPWEQDDLWFYQAQAHFREHLLRAASRHAIQSDHIFHIPLKMLLNDISSLPKEKVLAISETHRARRERQKETNMPYAFADGHALVSNAKNAETFKGFGIGGVFKGRVVRTNLLEGSASSADCVWLTQSATPASIVSAVGIGALICESGQRLGHAAAMARELGVTAVVGCKDAWNGIDDGDLVLVDGYSGVVIRLG